MNVKIKSPFDISVYGVGYFGIGKYKALINSKQTQQYRAWHGMLERCYSEKHHEIHQTYIDCIVCEEWHNYQIFAKWYDDNYYRINNEIMSLDKDWLYKGNKIYSPDTCIFAPQYINSSIVNKKNNRGELPIGVTIYQGKYRVRCRNNTGEYKHLGTHDTPGQAFEAYKTFKEAYIKQVAKSYKDHIPTKLYEAMINYEININD